MENKHLSYNNHDNQFNIFIPNSRNVDFPFSFFTFLSVISESDNSIESINAFPNQGLLVLSNISSFSDFKISN